ncbi:C-type lectin domain family 4 member E-like isoform X1 [Biomphalaria glabrata]|uniref:C-type lectin domain family 4 member E-like isoform X1 n=1 Tax=Biomphalaria glabrata TaxID=6526 RepID=A0A9W2ZEF5_BIOGL|nr:C-type lectin domain family 4 member E-like isoform X1 [Biomphalaria glabrata]KAI8752135.1 killer cell lectin-like receptor subfamily F member 1; partial [Biomphalaria glabrata]
MFLLLLEVMTTIYCSLMIISSLVSTSETKLPSFQRVENTLLVSLNTESTVQTRSVVDCALTCLSTNCTSFSFDDQQKVCQRGSITVNRVKTYTLIDIYISCNTDDGFKLLIKGSVIACVWMSDYKVNYITARENCKAMSSHLVTIKTLQKLYLLQGSYGYKQQMWIGLNDIVAEGVYRWEDDNSECNATCRASIFEAYEPNDKDGNEDCICFHYREPKANDFPCDETLVFLCEKPFFNRP